MAGGAFVPTSGGKEYPGKFTGRVFLTCIFAATGGLIFGYDLGISVFSVPVLQSVPIYLSEVAPYKFRGAFNMMFQLFITIGILIANLLNYVLARWVGGDTAWRLSLGGAIVPGLIILLGSCFLSDSPNSEIERGNYEKAKDLLLKLRKVDNVDEEFNDLVEASEKAKLIVITIAIAMKFGLSGNPGVISDDAKVETKPKDTVSA
ncbi:hypothetical protein OIU76_017876 [Salix suchowensis]|nr:hypothetical protein OIU76_017876 [Salix suchowensis]